MNKPSLLFVDDEQQILFALRALFRQQYTIFTADNGREALNIIEKENIDIIVSDQRMPGMLGVELLKQVKEISPQTVRILLTGYSDADTVINTINTGEVYKFIQKPWDNIELRLVIESALEYGKKRNKNIAESKKKIEETQQVKSVESMISNTENLSVLVIDDDADVAKQLQQILKNKAKVFQCSTLERAENILQEHEVAIIVFELLVDEKDVSEFIKKIKTTHENIMTMVVSQDIDSEKAIDLINLGMIYRYFGKPVNKGILKISVEQGLKFYNRKKYGLSIDEPPKNPNRTYSI